MCSGSETGYSLEWLSVHHTHREKNTFTPTGNPSITRCVFSLWVDSQPERSHEEVSGDSERLPSLIPSLTSSLRTK